MSTRHNAALSLDERRSRLYNKIQSSYGVINALKLKTLIKNVSGAESNIIDNIEANVFKVEIFNIFSLDKKIEVYNTIDDIKPAHLLFYITTIAHINKHLISVIPLLRGTNRKTVIEPNLSIKKSVQGQINLNSGNMIHTYQKTVIDVQIMPPIPHMTAKIHGLATAAEMYRKINISEGE